MRDESHPSADLVYARYGVQLLVAFAEPQMPSVASVTL